MYIPIPVINPHIAICPFQLWTEVFDRWAVDVTSLRLGHLAIGVRSGPVQHQMQGEQQNVHEQNCRTA